uniref:Peptidase A1 domain-containing protein n=1 Tax=Oryza glumipatula TaxID=40148 RepID=A0A0E0AEF6_9ORYZ
MPHSSYLALSLAVAAVLAMAAVEVSGLGFDLHHRYSPIVQRWAEERGHAGVSWPAGAEVIGSPEYYSALSRHDHALFARRGLAQGDGLVTFADGNITLRLDGSLHYAEVAVGTPNTTFLVALDTGSDLFWVPCDCKQCAPLGNLTAVDGGGGPELRQYSPSKSSTSKTVTCASNLCDQPNACATATSSCPYAVRYAMANTSSSGELVEDVLYLTREKGAAAAAGAAVKTPVVFGCGQVQTGSFLDGAAADGLMGLGMEKVSVPSILASTGVVKSNSFSMCFSKDGLGRINFGDTGSADQSETPFIVKSTHSYYNISITSMSVGDKNLPLGFYAIADSGTSFTYLNDPAYTAYTTNFNAQISERRANFSGSTRSGPFPFEYCYSLSPDQTTVELPIVSLTTNGGAVFPVTSPVYPIAAQMTNGEIRIIGYCLAVIKSNLPIDIIGQNFMTGLKVVFNREKSVLGWQKFDCYKDEKMTDDGSSVGSPSPSPGPTTHVFPQPQESDSPAGRTPIPGAAPVPRSSSAAGGGRAGFRLLSSMALLLLAAAAAAVF